MKYALLCFCLQTNFILLSAATFKLAFPTGKKLIENLKEKHPTRDDIFQILNIDTLMSPARKIL